MLWDARELFEAQSSRSDRLLRTLQGGGQLEEAVTVCIQAAGVWVHVCVCTQAAGVCVCVRGGVKLVRVCV